MSDAISPDGSEIHRLAVFDRLHEGDGSALFGAGAHHQAFSPTVVGTTLRHLVLVVRGIDHLDDTAAAAVEVCRSRPIDVDSVLVVAFEGIFASGVRVVGRIAWIDADGPARPSDRRAGAAAAGFFLAHHGMVDALCERASVDFGIDGAYEVTVVHERGRPVHAIASTR